MILRYVTVHVTLWSDPHYVAPKGLEQKVPPVHKAKPEKCHGHDRAMDMCSQEGAVLLSALSKWIKGSTKKLIKEQTQKKDLVRSEHILCTIQIADPVKGASNCDIIEIACALCSFPLFDCIIFYSESQCLREEELHDGTFTHLVLIKADQQAQFAMGAKLSCSIVK